MDRFKMVNPQSRRWYDQKPNVSGLVRMVHVSPPEVQGAMGRSISTLVKQDCKVTAVNGSMRSLGSSKVLSLYKAKNKQRILDRNHDLFKAMNELYILPDEQQSHIVASSLELIDNIFRYLQICQDQKKPLATSEIEQIAGLYLRHGHAHCQNFVENYRPAILSGEGADRLQATTRRRGDEELSGG